MAMGVPPKWSVQNGKSHQMDDNSRYPYIRKPPYMYKLLELAEMYKMRLIRNFSFFTHLLFFVSKHLYSSTLQTRVFLSQSLRLLKKTLERFLEVKSLSLVMHWILRIKGSVGDLNWHWQNMFISIVNSNNGGFLKPWGTRLKWSKFGSLGGSSILGNPSDLPFTKGHTKVAKLRTPFLPKFPRAQESSSSTVTG